MHMLLAWPDAMCYGVIPESTSLDGTSAKDTQQYVRISTDSCSTVKVTLLALNPGGAPLVYVLHSCYGATHSAAKSCSC